MNEKKRNCWEFKKCGRQPQGENAFISGVCPAAIETHLTGVNGGKNAGRVCWVVAGTMCGAAVQGSFALKYKSCEQCDFYQAVKEEEGDNFVPLEVLKSLFLS
ncbi:MAG TPA: hypothetical protein DCP92_11865 [Nitrospiraceae bacterium]|nr:hypothetical protein [Nitrospiraceae bacterium]